MDIISILSNAFGCDVWQTKISPKSRVRSFYETNDGIPIYVRTTQSQADRARWIELGTNSKEYYESESFKYLKKASENKKALLVFIIISGLNKPQVYAAPLCEAIKKSASDIRLMVHANNKDVCDLNETIKVGDDSVMYGGEHVYFVLNKINLNSENIACDEYDEETYLNSHLHNKILNNQIKLIEHSKDLFYNLNEEEATEICSIGNKRILTKEKDSKKGLFGVYMMTASPYFIIGHSNNRERRCLEYIEKKEHARLWVCGTNNLIYHPLHYFKTKKEARACEAIYNDFCTKYLRKYCLNIKK